MTRVKSAGDEVQQRLMAPTLTEAPIIPDPDGGRSGEMIKEGERKKAEGEGLWS